MTPTHKMAIMLSLRHKLNKASYEDIREQCKGDDRYSCAPNPGVHDKKLRIRAPPSHSNTRNTIRTLGGR